MKKMLLCAMMAPAFASAQATGLSTPIPFGSYGFLNGKSIYNKDDQFEEGTYTFPKFPAYANVTLKGGRYYPSIKTLVNLLDNEMIFTDSTGLMYAAIVPIESIEFLPSESVSAKTVFKTGFPSVDGG